MPSGLSQVVDDSMTTPREFMLPLSSTPNVFNMIESDIPSNDLEYTS